MSNLEELLQWRDIEPDDACPKCGGCGSTMYGNTATWGRGVGGDMMTYDICDKCWGSGSKSHPWINLRKLSGILTDDQKKELQGDN